MVLDTPVAVLGLGAMGSRMAARLIEAGCGVTVWNRTPEAAVPLADLGAQVAASPAQAAANAAVVIAMVRDDEASREVWLADRTGAIHGLQPGTIAIDSSTLTPGWTRSLGDALERAGVRFLEAPVAGSRPQAEAGQLIYFVGGDGAVLHSARPILNALGGAIHPVGPVGAAAAVKLAVNSLFGIQVAAMAELLGTLGAIGLDGTQIMEVIGATPVCSPAARAAGTAMLGDSFQPMFPIDLVAKDFSYAIELAAGSGVAGPMIKAAATVFQQARVRGLAHENLTAVAKLYRA